MEGTNKTQVPPVSQDEPRPRSKSLSPVSQNEPRAHCSKSRPPQEEEEEEEETHPRVHFQPVHRYEEVLLTKEERDEKRPALPVKRNRARLIEDIHVSRIEEKDEDDYVDYDDEDEEDEDDGLHPFDLAYGPIDKKNVARKKAMDALNAKKPIDFIGLLERSEAALLRRAQEQARLQPIPEVDSEQEESKTEEESSDKPWYKKFKSPKFNLKINKSKQTSSDEGSNKRPSIKLIPRKSSVKLTPIKSSIRQQPIMKSISSENFVQKITTKLIPPKDSIKPTTSKSPSRQQSTLEQISSESSLQKRCRKLIPSKNSIIPKSSPQQQPTSSPSQVQSPAVEENVTSDDNKKNCFSALLKKYNLEQLCRHFLIYSDLILAIGIFQLGIGVLRDVKDVIDGLNRSHLCGIQSQTILAHTTWATIVMFAFILSALWNALTTVILFVGVYGKRLMWVKIWWSTQGISLVYYVVVYCLNVMDISRGMSSLIVTAFAIKFCLFCYITYYIRQLSREERRKQAMTAISSSI